MKGNNYNNKLPKIDILKIEYFENLMSANDIAKKYNTTNGAVLNKLKRYNLQPRTLQESQSLKANYMTITKEFNLFINGLLLGDGTIVYTTNKKSCWYGHSDKNKEYLEWLKYNFESFGIKCSEIKPHTNNTWSLKTKSYRNFTIIREKWYPDGKKKIPKIDLSPVTLFNWYIGDGSYDKKSKSKKVVICSQFDENGKLLMSNKLKKIGITNSVYPNCIYIKNKKLFFEYILNHNYSIPESYKYKF